MPQRGREERCEMKLDKHHSIVMAKLELSFEDTYQLRRDSMRLHRWFERECGDSNGHASFCVVREPDGKTYLEILPHTGKRRMQRIPDVETGARKRIDAICKANGLNYYIQGDCRGMALYLSREEINDTNYNQVGRWVG